jgi:hypothetical protein
MSPLHSLFKNAALLTIVLYLHWRTKAWPRGAWGVPVGLAVACALVVGLGFPIRHIAVEPIQTGIPPEPQESQFARFREFDGQIADLTKGTCLVAFVSLECEHCHDLVSSLGERSRQGPLPPVYLICYGKAADAPAFLAQTNTAFRFTCVEPGVFFNYIGENPPRLYLLQNGQVRAFWDRDTFDPAQLASWGSPAR